MALAFVRNAAPATTSVCSPMTAPTPTPQVHSSSSWYELRVAVAACSGQLGGGVSLALCCVLQALIDGKVLCVHGGLSPDIRTLDQVSSRKTRPQCLAFSFLNELQQGDKA